MQTEGILNLVQSMSKAEKRYFRRFAEMTGGQQCERYLLLFTAMEDLEEDDGAELAAKIQDEALRANLPVYRNRLQSLILRSLRTLYAGRSTASEIRQLLEEIEILYERRLFSACMKRLDKALTLATAHEQESALLEIHNWRRKLNGQTPLAQQDALLTAIHQEEKGCMDRLQTERACAHLHERQRVRARLRLVARTPEDQLADRLENAPEPANFLAQVHFLSARAIREFSSNQVTEAATSYRRIMGIWDAAPHRIVDHPDLYLASFNNYLGTLLVGDRNHDEFLQAVQKLRKLPDLPRHTRVHFQWLAYHQELIFSMNFAGYEATLLLVSEIEEWITQNAQEILVPLLLAFYFNITMFFFVYSEYSRANRWLTRILNQPGRAERRDIRNFARIFQVLLQFELQNFDLNDYLVRSAYRYLNRKDELYDFERAIFTLIRKCGALPNERARRTVYQDFRTEIQDMSKGKTASLGQGELMLWVESKLQGLPLRTLFEQKLAENQSAANMR